MDAWHRQVAFLALELSGSLPAALRRRYEGMLGEALAKALRGDPRSVEMLALKSTTVRALHQADVETIGQFVALSEDYVNALPGVGPTVLVKLRESLIACAMEGSYSLIDTEVSPLHG